MKKRSALKVVRSIGPVVALTRAHNALVNLIGGMKGVRGVTITVSDSQIIIDLDPGALAGIVEQNVVDVLSPLGQIIKVPRHSSYTTPTAFTNNFTVAATLNAASVHTTIDSNGVAVNFSVSNHAQVTYNKIELSTGGGTNLARFDPNGLRISSNTNTAAIDFSLITKDLNIREVDVCDANVAKKMLVLGSAPY